MKYIIRDSEANDFAVLGGKVGTLARLRPYIDVIPSWFALKPNAFEDSLPPQQRESFFKTLDDTSRRATLDQMKPVPSVLDELGQALAELCPLGEQVAVRSSALDEDGRHHSFAGQYESFLFVSADDLSEKVAAVWRSGFSDRVTAYRKEHGLTLIPSAPAVLVQRMVRAETAGVAFGADPASGECGVAVVCAVRGIGANLVSGECDGETYRVEASGLQIDRQRAKDELLSAEQVRAIADLVWSAGRILGSPQDIEWAYEGTRLHLLQARPITTLGAIPDSSGALSIWDNSNIAESYNGVTTPLTFSFARRAYEEVYRQFCRLLRVPESKIAQNDNTFRNMLGLIRGRVYYNLLNWYRALAMLPGFTFNRRFMEQMMGVKEPLPEAVASELAGATWRDRFWDGFRLALSAGALLGSHFTIERRKRRFLQRLDEALGPARPDLSRWRVDELSAHYRELERRLLPHWDAPLVNDFLAMIFFGMLRKCVAKWCRDASGSLHNDLLAGEGGIISSEPATAIRAMARIVRNDPALVNALCNGSLEEINRAMDRAPRFRERFNAYLDRFGDRCLEELKLESSTLHDDPLPLLRSVGNVARVQDSAFRSQGSGVRDLAEERVREAIRFRPMRRLLFRWFLRNARARVRDRENLRFERTRLFARARQIFIELGRRLSAMGALDDHRDVFYLEVNEILGFVEGTATTTNLRGLAAVRREEFARYRRMAAPPARFETRGAVHHGNLFRSTAATENLTGEERTGLGCCAGIVRGRVRVVTDPRAGALQPGEILVAERTDPGWIMLFPAAAGLIVERGSLLSHSAIVARELGIPAVVSVPGVMAWLRDGDVVELDGSLGVVTRISRAEDVSHGR